MTTWVRASCVLSLETPHSFFLNILLLLFLQVLSVNRAFDFDGAPRVVRSFQGHRKHSLIKISERAEKTEVFSWQNVFLYSASTTFYFVSMFF